MPVWGAKIASFPDQTKIFRADMVVSTVFLLSLREKYNNVHMNRTALLTLAVVAGFACSHSAYAQYIEIQNQSDVKNYALETFEAQRSQLFNFGWRFRYGKADAAVVTATGFDDSQWRTVDLPHDFQFEQPWEENGSKGRGFKPMGEGWYRKTFVADESWQGKQVLLDFGGIMYVADVYVNGTKVAESEYGYIGFETNITKHLRLGEENTVAVWASTCQENASRWYTGGGIFRDVYLKLQNMTHITRHGLYITTPEITDAKATVRVQVEVDRWREQDVALEATLFDADGKRVGESHRIEPDHTIANCTEMQMPQMEIDHPHRWDIDDPYLYTCKVVLKSGDMTIDEAEEQFGIRTLEFDKDFGFKLNGRKVFLKGMANHHDMGALGVAAFDSGIERTMREAKARGFNSIRCSHNPYSRNFTRIADRLGLLVVDELIDKWSDKDYWGGRKPFMQIWPQLITEYIKRDRNCPSVIMWSLGNELQTRGDWSGYDTKDWGVTTYRIFDQLVKRYDDTRKTTVAMFPARAGGQRNTPDFHTWLYAPELACATEVASFNYQWRAYEGYYEHNPNLILYQSEATTNELLAPYYGMNQERGVGMAYWGAIEYWGESNGWPKKGWNFSYFRHTMEPYPQAWLIQSAFQPENPVVHIGVADKAGESLNWNDVKVGQLRLSENWNLTQRRKITLYTFTNTDEVELFVNGQSMGVKQNETDDVTRRNIICWPDLEYGRGGKVTAVGRNAGKEVCRHELQTTGEAKALRIISEPQTGCLSASPEAWEADGMELQYLLVEAIDSKGRRVVSDNQHSVTVEVSGAADLFAIDNGDHYTDELFTPDICTKQLHDGTLQVILRSRRGEAGKVQVKVSAPGLKSAKTVLATK